MAAAKRGLLAGAGRVEALAGAARPERSTAERRMCTPSRCPEAQPALQADGSTATSGVAGSGGPISDLRRRR